MNIPKFRQQLLDFSDRGFEDKALQLFHFQAQKNPVYADFIHQIGIKPNKVTKIQEIPFLPIRFFKSHQVLVENTSIKKTFTSSGTGSVDQLSKHGISNLEFYEQLSQKTFENFYGKLSEFQIFALLPSYLERDGSSLIYMVNHFLEKSQPNSDYFLYNHEELKETLDSADKSKPILLLGVTFALIDFASFLNSKYPDYSLPENSIVMETGGMKGRKKEMIREEVHQQLKVAFGLESIHSEYGMTELLSQAYSSGKGYFATPPHLKILFRDVNDPFDLSKDNGGINVIDLANMESCAFIETQDLGKRTENGQFEVLGRFDYSDVRGCNLLVI